MYDKVMFKMLHRLWRFWHSDSRRFFDSLYKDQYLWTLYESRPFWHLCCNGNAGGWRTRLCDALEDYDTGYRKYEDRIYNKDI